MDKNSGKTEPIYRLGEYMTQMQPKKSSHVLKYQGF